MKKIKQKIDECEIEGYIDLKDEDKPKFKVKLSGKCPSNIVENLNN